MTCKNYAQRVTVCFCVSLERGLVFAIAIPNTIDNASKKGVSTVYIICGQFVGVNKPSRRNAYQYHCAEGLALQCFSLCND